MDGSQNKFFRLVKSLDTGLHTMEKIILSWSILVITAMTAGNVVYRTFTGQSWHFAAEISRLAIIVATFMGISYAARKGRHISMSAFFDLSPKPLKKVLAIVNPLITASILFIMSYYAFLYTHSVFASGRTTAALEFPFWIMVVALPIGMFLGALQFIRNSWVNIKHEEVYLAQEKKDYDEQ